MTWVDWFRSLPKRATIAFRVTKQLLRKSHLHDGVSIGGDEVFVRATVVALDLLREQAPDAYALVKRHVGDILASTPSGVFSSVRRLGPTMVMIGPTWSGGSPIEYAGVLAHEAYHCELYQAARANRANKAVSRAAYSGEEAERQCLRYQCDVLKRLGLDEGRLKKYEGAMETKWWEVPFDQRKY